MKENTINYIEKMSLKVFSYKESYWIMEKHIYRIVYADNLDEFCNSEYLELGKNAFSAQWSQIKQSDILETFSALYGKLKHVDNG